ncbi:MAG: lipopolysaccharide biosynthesis protein [Sphingomonas sp.]|uniref:lipopolysaccharide biosynthesis protein n=1 Tax=Sphingomonas sp. TaxID=28214 RepID=UPI001B2665BE|nr:lipopolysaccharide biosynthesis protein [Sphingomonas sp.]MBO9622302.1 lipopolysaccharide biosynthesis protein [Sphingomonas sp.]
MTESTAPAPNQAIESLKHQVRSAVLWRSGTQIAGQILAWGSTFVVLRLLSPSDYGLFAMTQVVLVLLNMLNGYGLASALIQRGEAGVQAQRQLFGMLLLLNLALAAAQVALAPLAAAYYRQPLVADLLRVQALLYLATPFIALPQALLSRAMDFKLQAKANLASGAAGAVAALAGALAGLGVWTLVLAPIALFGVRAIALTWAARALVRPSFDFRGAGDMARYGVVMATGQLFWFLQSQADVFIAGRQFEPHLLGIYTTSLFLTQIFVSKFVPPLNEVAFSAYARLKDDRAAVGTAFVKSARLIMTAAMPFYLGLAVTAEPLVAVVLGPKWAEAAPVVQWLALAMPMMTLQTLYSPASDACGRPGISAQNGAAGALLLPIAFLIGVRWGVMGLVAAWFAAYPLYLGISTWRTLPVIGVRLRDLAAAIAPALLASAAMALGVALLDRLLPALPSAARLALLASTGAALYVGLLSAFARPMLREVVALIRDRPAR